MNVHPHQLNHSGWNRRSFPTHETTPHRKRENFNTNGVLRTTGNPDTNTHTDTHNTIKRNKQTKQTFASVSASGWPCSLCAEPQVLWRSSAALGPFATQFPDLGYAAPSGRHVRPTAIKHRGPHSWGQGTFTDEGGSQEKDTFRTLLHTSL